MMIAPAAPSGLVRTNFSTALAAVSRGACELFLGGDGLTRNSASVQHRDLHADATAPLDYENVSAGLGHNYRRAYEQQKAGRGQQEPGRERLPETEPHH